MASIASALVACTQAPTVDPAPAPAPRSAAPAPSPAGVFVDVVASLTGPGAPTDATYLEGARQAAGEITDGGSSLELRVHDDRGDPAETRRLLGEVHGGALATLLVGPPVGIPARRLELAASGAPLILLGGDLYTSRRLVRETFMTGVPLRWQLEVLARYLVADRRHERIAVAIEDGYFARDAAEAAVRAALAEEGVEPSALVAIDPAGVGDAVPAAAGSADALIVIASAATTARVAEALVPLPELPQLAVTSEGLSPEASTLPRGTVAPYPYTWAGWAEPVPRVSRFRTAFEEAHGRPPEGFAQEGYDAVHALARAYRRSGEGRRAALVAELERFAPGSGVETFSAIPVRLGPDDHTFVNRFELGLFVADGPAAREPWVSEPPYWRPLVRTFTFDGERTVFIDRDVRVFFPRWRKPRPRPKYPSARFGITTGPDDPLR